MKKLISLLLLFTVFTVKGQIFDIGIVTGPVTTTEMNTISSPLLGQQIFNSTTNTIWVYYNSQWNDTGIGGGGSDGNDFVNSGSVTGENLTLVIPNQTNPVIDMSAFALDSDLALKADANNVLTLTGGAQTVSKQVNFDGLSVTTTSQFRANGTTWVGGYTALSDEGISIESTDGSNKLRIRNREGIDQSGRIGLDPKGNWTDVLEFDWGVDDRWEIDGSPVITQANAAGLGIAGGGTDDQNATEVPIIDTGANFTATDVEGALLELFNGYFKSGSSINVQSNTIIENTTDGFGIAVDFGNKEAVLTGGEVATRSRITLGANKAELTGMTLAEQTSAGNDNLTTKEWQLANLGGGTGLAGGFNLINPTTDFTLTTTNFIGNNKQSLTYVAGSDDVTGTMANVGVDGDRFLFKKNTTTSTFKIIPDDGVTTLRNADDLSDTNQEFTILGYTTCVKFGTVFDCTGNFTTAPLSNGNLFPDTNAAHPNGALATTGWSGSVVYFGGTSGDSHIGILDNGAGGNTSSITITGLTASQPYDFTADMRELTAQNCYLVISGIVGGNQFVNAPSTTFSPVTGTFTPTGTTLTIEMRVDNGVANNGGEIKNITLISQ